MLRRSLNLNFVQCISVSSAIVDGESRAKLSSLRVFDRGENNVAWTIPKPTGFDEHVVASRLLLADLEWVILASGAHDVTS